MAAPTPQADKPVTTMTLTLQSSHRLTPRISLHVFSLALDHAERTIRPSQHITLQLPPDLDPIGGSRSLSDEDRRLTLTPCHLEHDAQGRLRSLAVLAGHGRVTGLLGLPRPQGPLTAELVGVGKGISDDVLDASTGLTCVAGGTGMACFLALASAPEWTSLGRAAASTFSWSIRGEDFAIVEFVLERGMLRPKEWQMINIFVTAGEESTGRPAGKSESWWTTRLDTLRAKHQGNLVFRIGRMTKGDLEVLLEKEQKQILFCGSKSLQWQIKMWSLGTATVHCTEW